MAQITPRVHGTVTDVLVHENWWVKPGQVLVRLDTRDYEARFAEARAELTRARESVAQLCAAVAVADEQRRATQSQIQVAQAKFHQAELDFHCAQQLAEEQIIPAQRFFLFCIVAFMVSSLFCGAAPGFFRGIGSGLILVPMTILTLAAAAKEQMGTASALYNKAATLLSS